MKIIALIALGAVQAAIPNTGRRHRMATMGKSAEVRENGGKYGYSGDLMSASLISALMPNRVFGAQAKRDDTWFYYKSPFEDEWYKVVYVPHAVSYGKYPSANAEITTADGNVGYTLGPCNDAVKALYDATEAGEDTVALKADCEAKCVLFTEATDYFDAKDCNDPQGSLRRGSRGSTHPWMEALYAFEDQISVNSDELEDGWFDSFVPPHVVGSKIYPELASGEEQEEFDEELVHVADTTVVENVTDHVVGEVELSTVSLPDEETTTEETTTETTAATTTAATTAAAKDEDSGFLVNGVSMVLLFVSMAIFK